MIRWLQRTQGFGVRPAEVFRHEIVDHQSLELFLEIDDVEGNIELLRDPPGIMDVVERAAGAELSRRRRKREWSQTCMEMPITSCPSSWRRAAVTEESTPPLMATTTLFLTSIFFHSKPGDHARLK